MQIGQVVWLWLRNRQTDRDTHHLMYIYIYVSIDKPKNLKIFWVIFQTFYVGFFIIYDCFTVLALRIDRKRQRSVFLTLHKQKAWPIKVKSTLEYTLELGPGRLKRKADFTLILFGWWRQLDLLFLSNPNQASYMLNGIQNEPET